VQVSQRVGRAAAVALASGFASRLGASQVWLLMPTCFHAWRHKVVTETALSVRSRLVDGLAHMVNDAVLLTALINSNYCSTYSQRQGSGATACAAHSSWLGKSSLLGLMTWLGAFLVMGMQSVAWIRWKGMVAAKQRAAGTLARVMARALAHARSYAESDRRFEVLFSRRAATTALSGVWGPWAEFAMARSPRRIARQLAEALLSTVWGSWRLRAWWTHMGINTRRAEVASGFFARRRDVTWLSMAWACWESGLQKQLCTQRLAHVRATARRRIWNAWATFLHYQQARRQRLPLELRMTNLVQDHLVVALWAVWSQHARLCWLRNGLVRCMSHPSGPQLEHIGACLSVLGICATHKGSAYMDQLLRVSRLRHVTPLWRCWVHAVHVVQVSQRVGRAAAVALASGLQQAHVRTLRWAWHACSTNALGHALGIAREAIGNRFRTEERARHRRDHVVIQVLACWKRTQRCRLWFAWFRYARGEKMSRARLTGIAGCLELHPSRLDTRTIMQLWRLIAHCARVSRSHRAQRLTLCTQSDREHAAVCILAWAQWRFSHAANRRRIAAARVLASTIVRSCTRTLREAWCLCAGRAAQSMLKLLRHAASERLRAEHVALSKELELRLRQVSAWDSQWSVSSAWLRHATQARAMNQARVHATVARCFRSNLALCSDAWTHWQKGAETQQMCRHAASKMARVLNFTYGGTISYAWRTWLAGACRSLSIRRSSARRKSRIYGERWSFASSQLRLGYILRCWVCIACVARVSTRGQRMAGMLGMQYRISCLRGAWRSWVRGGSGGRARHLLQRYAGISVGHCDLLVGRMLWHVWRCRVQSLWPRKHQRQNLARHIQRCRKGASSCRLAWTYWRAAVSSQCSFSAAARALAKALHRAHARTLRGAWSACVARTLSCALAVAHQATGERLSERLRVAERWRQQRHRALGQMVVLSARLLQSAAWTDWVQCVRRARRGTLALACFTCSREHSTLLCGLAWVHWRRESKVHQIRRCATSRVSHAIARARDEVMCGAWRMWLAGICRGLSIGRVHARLKSSTYEERLSAVSFRRRISHLCRCWLNVTRIARVSYRVQQMVSGLAMQLFMTYWRAAFSFWAVRVRASRQRQFLQRFSHVSMDCRSNLIGRVFLRTWWCISSSERGGRHHQKGQHIVDELSLENGRLERELSDQVCDRKALERELRHVKGRHRAAKERLEEITASTMVRESELLTSTVATSAAGESPLRRSVGGGHSRTHRSQSSSQLHSELHLSGTASSPQLFTSLSLSPVMPCSSPSALAAPGSQTSMGGGSNASAACHRGSSLSPERSGAATSSTAMCSCTRKPACRCKLRQCIH